MSSPRGPVAAVLITLALLALFPSLEPLAQDDKNVTVTATTGAGAAGGKYALLIGVNQYDRPDITPLKYAVADVESVYQALTDPACGGFPKRNVKLLTTKAEGDLLPKKANILFWIGWLKKHVQAADTVVLYFSGHGITDGESGESYLLPMDADIRNSETLAGSGIQVNYIHQRLTALPAKKLLFFLDACRNDPAAGKGDADAPMTKSFEEQAKVEGEGRGTFYSCKVGERSYEWHDQGHGVFTYYVVQGLRGAAAGSDGNVTLDRLTKYVTQNVADWARDHDRNMTPWLAYEGTGTWALTKGLPQAASVTINTEPSGAKLTLVSPPPEMEMGLAPKSLANIEGTLQVRVEMDGCQPKTETITVEPGEQRNVLVRLLVFDPQKVAAWQQGKNISITPTDRPAAGGQPVEPPPVRKVPFVLENPPEGYVAGRTLVLAGRGPPGALVNYTINWLGRSIDPKVTGDFQAGDRIRINDDGHFMSPSIPMFPSPESGALEVTGYRIVCQVISENVEGPTQITRLIRGSWRAPQQVTPGTVPASFLPPIFTGRVMSAKEAGVKPKKSSTERAIIGGILGGLFGRRQPKTDTEKFLAAAGAALIASKKRGELDLYVAMDAGNRERKVRVIVDDRFAVSTAAGPLPVSKLEPGDIVRIQVAEQISPEECSAQQIMLLRRKGGGMIIGGSSAVPSSQAAPQPISHRPPQQIVRPPPQGESRERSQRNWSAVSFRANGVRLFDKDLASNSFKVKSRGQVYTVFVSSRTAIVAGNSRRSFQTLDNSRTISVKGKHISQFEVEASQISIH